MSKIGISEVKRIAALAHIGLTDDQVAAMATELGEIVNFVEKLSEVDTSKIDPTDQVTGLVDVLRKDEVKVCEIDQDELLQNAPERDGSYIKVRRVL
ncbi:MAG: Asp-tRNA(Asn)/Glu-tRNA(Gln) amidotransferase subunit GatC [Candidatus Saccharimonadia bacterium]